VVKTELFASVFELNTQPCESAAEIDDALVALRRAAAEAAETEGLAIAAAGTHPFAKPEAQPIVKEERYVTFVGYAGISARRQGVQGLHVHVGMESADDCWNALEGMLPWLPVVLALSVNSPWLAGELTGLASNRAPLLAELPRAAAPPAFGSYGGWEAWVERLVRLGVTQDYTRIWWDVRPHPRLGTLEVRMPDQPTDVRLSAAYAALVQALAATVLRNGSAAPHPPPDPARRGDYLQNRWAAARFGPSAELIHPDGERVARASELGAELLELVAPAARELGSAELLARIDVRSAEAELQVQADSPEEAAADVVSRTVA
jgi:carboxylate-amine ligase